MKFFLSDPFERKQRAHQDEPVIVAVQESLHNITEGGEFLDDAIRMQEQPFMDSHTEESMAPGSASANELW